jgi:hypothetical protein
MSKGCADLLKQLDIIFSKFHLMVEVEVVY